MLGPPSSPGTTTWFIEIVKGFGCQEVFGESFRRIFSAKRFRRNVFSRFLVLEPHFEFGPAWGLGLTGWGLGAVAWGLGLRAEEVFGETFLKGLEGFSKVLRGCEGF